MKNQISKTNFFVYAAILIIIAALLLLTMQPNITAWRRNVVDKLVAQSKASNNDSTKLGLLQQALLIDNTDPVATESLARFWRGRGEDQKALTVYTNHIAKPNYSYLAILALKAQDYNSALRYAQKSNTKDPNTAGLIAEANALYSLGKVSEGCDLAVKATKLDLNNRSAQDAVINCVILGGKPNEPILQPSNNLSEREQAYLLINNYVFNKGEEKLLGVKDKTASDYLVLSRLNSARGELDKAIEYTKKGLGLDVSNIALNKQAVELFKLTNNVPELETYTNRLNQLQFSKYQ